MLKVLLFSFYSNADNNYNDDCPKHHLIQETESGGFEIMICKSHGTKTYLNIRGV